MTVESTGTDVTSATSEATAVAHSVVVDIDLWVFMALLFACAVINARNYFNKIPTSSLLMLTGIVLRIVGRYFGMLGAAVATMDGIEAETILLIFLPALIFECAFSTDWYTFKKEIGQILMLATTAVILSAIQTAVVIRYILGFSDIFGWYTALMLGAILSATDHVSVVAQLKEVNADKRLETLIQGETLVNEGSVIVIFTAMMNGAIQSATKPEEIIKLFFRLSLGGIALGIGFGYMLSMWLKRLVNNPVLETLLTFITTYLLFFTADATSVHFSGAIGTVTFGLYMSAYGKTLISPSVETIVHEFWELLGTCIESLIFLLGGMLMGHFFTDFQSLEFSDIGYLFAIFMLLHVVRAITILIHWPFLRPMGYGCSYKWMIVLIVGGLKGTISIALALMVYHEPEFSERLRDLVLFWSVGVSALSVTFDSMILRFVVKMLGLESMTDVEENMLMSVTKSILETTNDQMGKMKKNDEYNFVNWESVAKSAGPETLFFNMLRATKNGRKLLKKQNINYYSEEILQQFNDSIEITTDDITYETRKRYYNTLKGLYWGRFEKGKCLGESALKLIESANRGLDSVSVKMNEWEKLERDIFPAKVLKVIRSLARLPLIGPYFRSKDYSYMTSAYDIARNFISAHVEAEELLDEMEIDIRKEVFEEVMKEPHEQIELAKEFLAANIANEYPEVYIFVQTRQASYTLLCSELKAIEDAYEEGVITELEYSELLDSVKRNIKGIQMATTPSTPTLIKMLKSCSIFKGLNTEDLETLATNTKLKDIEYGKVIFQDHEEIREVCVVLKGRVKEVGKDFEEEHYPGDVIGSQYLLPYFTRTQTVAQAVITSKVAFISMGDIKELMSVADFENRVWIQGAKKAMLLCRDSFGLLSALDTASISKLLLNCTLAKYYAEERVPLEVESILLNGRLSNGCRAFSFIPGHTGQTARAVKTCTLLRFSEDFAKYIRSSTVDFQHTLTRFDHQQQERTPRIKITAKPMGEICRNSSLEKLATPAVVALPPVKPGKYKLAQVSVDTEESRSKETMTPDKAPERKTGSSTMLARLLQKQAKERLNVTDTINQNSENKDDDSELLVAPSSERGHRQLHSKK